MSLQFRRINKQDLQTISEWRMNPEVTKYMYTSPELTIDSQMKWFSRITSDRTVSYWIISFSFKEIGVINLYDIDTVNKRCFWAYYIGDASVRGKGLGRNIECNIYDYVLRDLNLNKLSCEVLSFNKRVIEIHKHFGSQIEGVLRQHIYKDGEFYDVVRMAILRQEWELIRSSFEYEKATFDA